MYGPLRGPTSGSCEGLRPSAKAFYALRATKRLIILLWPVSGHFWCSVVTLVTFRSNLNNFKKIQKNPKIQKSQKCQPKKNIKTKTKN